MKQRSILLNNYCSYIFENTLSKLFLLPCICKVGTYNLSNFKTIRKLSLTDRFSKTKKNII